MINKYLKRSDFETRALPHLDDLYCTAFYVVGNESDAQDLILESFATAYRTWHECPFNPDCRVWLFRIMSNALVNKSRPPGSSPVMKNKTDEVDEYLLNFGLGNQQSVKDSNQAPLLVISEDEIRRAINDLPNDFRLIVILYLLAGFSYPEVAEITGIQLEAVRSRLLQGRNFLRKKLFDNVSREGSNDTSAGRVIINATSSMRSVRR
jgi:RNA polymerase sigma-70 factor (ECF subfamily)